MNSFAQYVGHYVQSPFIFLAGIDYRKLLVTLDVEYLRPLFRLTRRTLRKVFIEIPFERDWFITGASYATALLAVHWFYDTVFIYDLPPHLLQQPQREQAQALSSAITPATATTTTLTPAEEALSISTINLNKKDLVAIREKIFLLEKAGEGLTQSLFSNEEEKMQVMKRKVELLELNMQVQLQIDALQGEQSVSQRKELTAKIQHNLNILDQFLHDSSKTNDDSDGKIEQENTQPIMQTEPTAQNSGETNANSDAPNTEPITQTESVTKESTETASQANTEPHTELIIEGPNTEPSANHEPVITSE